MRSEESLSSDRRRTRSMYDPIEERALAQAARRGDEIAWRVLFTRHADAAYRYAYVRSSRRRERAEEAVQEAWMIAVRRLSHFDPERAPFGAWLQGILENVLANHRRKWALRDGRELALDAAPEPVSPEGDAGNERLALAFTQLAPEYQDAMRAKYVEGYSMQEIAQGWNRSPKAIESLLGRARAALREAYLNSKHQDRSQP